MAHKSWTEKLGLKEFDHPDYGRISPEEEEINDNQFNTAEAEETARTNLNFLAALVMPTVFRYFFPPVFLAIWQWLCQYVSYVRDFSQLAIGLPRGFGKTMLIKLFVVYCVLFTRKKFILVTCGTVTKACNIISDIMSMLSQPNVRKIFGDWKANCITDRGELKRFVLRDRTIIIMGFGADGDVRGITLENERPDVMVFDDIQTRKDADSELVSNGLEEWMIGTAMKAKSPHGCLFIFIANMYPTKHSLLRKIKRNPNWIKFIAGGIITNQQTGQAESLWEELQPLTQLVKEYQNDLSMGKPEVFYAEVLNDEHASVNNLIDLSKLPLYPFRDDDVHNGNFVIIDPATDKANADAVSIMYFEVHGHIPVCKGLKEGRMSPGETIAEALIFCLTHNCTLVAIEGTAYQSTLNYWFNFICTQRGIVGIDAVELYSAGAGQKAVRIMNMFKSLIAGEIFIHESCSAAVNSQISQFNPLRRDNVDGLLDCLTYAPKVLELYSHLLLANNIIEMQENSNIKVKSAEECSAF